MRNPTPRFHSLLIRTLVPFTRRPEFRAVLPRALDADADPDIRYVYFTDLTLAWLIATWILAMAVGVVAIIAQSVFAARPGPAGAVALTAVLAFGLTGVIDAYWRLLLAWAANRGWERSGRNRDRRSNLLMRLSTLNNFPLLLQCAVAAFFTWRFA